MDLGSKPGIKRAGLKIIMLVFRSKLLDPLRKFLLMWLGDGLEQLFKLMASLITPGYES